MAQTPKQSLTQLGAQDQKPIKRSDPTERDSSRASGRLDRNSLLRQSKSGSSNQIFTAQSFNDSSKPEIFNRHQPSKIFVTKCWTELQALIDSIKGPYHEQIKSLYGDEIYADLYVQLGEQALKPLHKCIIASRAFKLFSALKGFRVDGSVQCQDIIISKVQQSHDKQLESDDKENHNKKIPIDEEEETRIRKLREAIEIFRCQLPVDLINPELVVDFVRRTYLDTDLIEEETVVNQRIATWMKINRPEVVKASLSCSPDHRESFRTIQPDFEQLSISGSSSAMSTAGQSSMGAIKTTASVEDNESQHEQDVDHEGSNIESVPDESLTGSLLTRTETFEMISGKRAGTSEVSEAEESKNFIDDDNDDDTRQISVSGSVDANESDTSEVYRTTTRTGLKPKQFTTPVGIKASKVGTPSPRPAAAPSSTSNTPKGPTGSAPAKQVPTAAKRTSAAAIAKTPEGTNKPSTLRVKPTTSVRPNSKPTVIARAHPISMERSQSPGTGNLVVRGASKNFIAANKKMITKIEKKVLSSPSSTQPHGDSHQAGPSYDTETGGIADPSFLILEPLNTDQLAAQLDRFTLAAESKLAEALSRLFINEILADSIVEVANEKQIQAHKCILAIRSPYLNDLINKQSLPLNTPESTPSKSLQPLKIDLKEYSHAAVYFSILHIYSGIVKVPDDLDIEELTKLSQLLHVNTLRQVCQHNLRMNYCHYFHKPCNVCCLGVLKTLPLAWRYDYTELYTKCLQWIGAHFAQIFCLEEFSKLKPHDLIEECYNETLSQLTPDNVIQRTIECQKLLKNLPRVKWTEPIICLVGRQLEDFCHYVADNYEKILQTESFLNLGKSCWECEVLEENLLAAMNHLKPDSGCKTLIQLDKIECSIETYCEEPRSVSESFANLVGKMRKYCERYLLKEAGSVVHCSSWRQMNHSLQKRIKDQALLATDFDEPSRQLAAKPKLPSSQIGRHHPSSPSPQLLHHQNSGNTSGSEGARSPSNRSTPESRLKSPNTTYLQPPKAKPAATRQVKILK